MTDERDLEAELRRAASVSKPSRVVEEGRATANDLRDDGRAALGEIVDELCDALQASQRQIAQFGFDLHDQGMQEVVALRNDLQLFRDQLVSVLDESEDRRRLLGRVDDFLARASSLDGSLRGVAASANTVGVAGQALSETLAEIVDDSTVSVETIIDPAIDEVDLTEPQRVTIIRVVENALANVVQHSGAQFAHLHVRCVPEGIEVEVVDDGRGFDVEQALARAPADRRFGLTGMQERIRVLGGTLSLTSRPGGPTRVFALVHCRPKN